MRQSTKGSAHVVIIIILVIALLAVLGFVFWQNFVQKAANDTASTTVTNSKDDEKTAPTQVKGSYDGDGYSFAYPTKGWKLVEEADYEGTKHPSVRSEDYEPYMGMGLKAGASVDVYISDLNQDDTVDKTIAGLKELEYIKDLKKIVVAGEDAYSMRSGYEGWRSTTDIYHNGKSYTIVYQYVNEKDAATYKDAYEKIIATFALD